LYNFHATKLEGGIRSEAAGNICASETSEGENHVEVRRALGGKLLVRYRANRKISDPWLPTTRGS
jgi:hypothetical protein